MKPVEIAPLDRLWDLVFELLGSGQDRKAIREKVDEAILEYRVQKRMEIE